MLRVYLTSQRYLEIFPCKDNVYLLLGRGLWLPCVAGDVHRYYFESQDPV